MRRKKYCDVYLYGTRTLSSENYQEIVITMSQYVYLKHITKDATKQTKRLLKTSVGSITQTIGMSYVLALSFRIKRTEAK